VSNTPEALLRELTSAGISKKDQAEFKELIKTKSIKVLQDLDVALDDSNFWEKSRIAPETRETIKKYTRRVKTDTPSTKSSSISNIFFFSRTFFL